MNQEGIDIRMSKFAKKLGIMLVACAMACTMFTGCGEKKANSAEAAVKAFLQAAKEVEFDDMAVYTTDDTWDDQIEEMVTVDAWEEFLEMAAPKITYEITNVEDNGTETTVTVNLKYLDGTEVYTAVMNEFVTESMTKMTENPDMTEDELLDILDNIMDKHMKNMTETYSEKTLEFVCENKNGYCINNVGEDFAAVLTANLTAIASTLGQDAIAQ